MTRHVHADLIHAWAEEGFDVEFFFGDEWVKAEFPEWNPEFKYRRAATKPSINWDHVAPEYKWMASDHIWGTFLYKNKPHMDIAGEWGDEGTPELKDADAFGSFNRGTCDWKDSLVQRPE